MFIISVCQKYFKKYFPKKQKWQNNYLYQYLTITFSAYILYVMTIFLILPSYTLRTSLLPALSPSFPYSCVVWKSTSRLVRALLSTFFSFFVAESMFLLVLERLLQLLYYLQWLLPLYKHAYILLHGHTSLCLNVCVCVYSQISDPKSLSYNILSTCRQIHSNMEAVTVINFEASWRLTLTEPRYKWRRETEECLTVKKQKWHCCVGFDLLVKAREHGTINICGVTEWIAVGK